MHNDDVFHIQYTSTIQILQLIGVSCVIFCTVVRINKNNLDPEDLEKLFYQCSYILSPKEACHTQLVLQEILGFEERLTIAKRIATIVLLAENMSRYKISVHLKLSQSTVASTANKLNNGEYFIILSTLGKNKTDYYKRLKTLDSSLHRGGILPHYNGLDRYKYSN